VGEGFGTREETEAVHRKRGRREGVEGRGNGENGGVGRKWGGGGVSRWENGRQARGVSKEERIRWGVGLGEWEGERFGVTDAEEATTTHRFISAPLYHVRGKAPGINR